MDVGGSLIWLEGTEDRADKVIFDPGYEGGQLHIYEKVESIEQDNAQQEIKEELGSKTSREDLPRRLLKARTSREPTLTYGVETGAGVNELHK